jgi:hypothetical protein
MAEELNLFQQALTNIPRNFGRRLGESIYLYDSPERQAAKAEASYYQSRAQLLDNQRKLIGETKSAQDVLLKGFDPVQKAQIQSMRDADGRLTQDAVNLAKSIQQGNTIYESMLLNPENNQYRNLIQNTPKNELMNLSVDLSPEEAVFAGRPANANLKRNLYTGEIITETPGAFTEAEQKLRRKRETDPNAQYTDVLADEAAREAVKLNKAKDRTIETDKERQMLAGANTGWIETDKLFAKQLNDWYNGDRIASLDSKNKLKRAAEALKSGDNKISGRFVGLLPNYLLPDETLNTRQEIEGVIQKSLRLTLGAAFTEDEAKMLMARGFNPLLDESQNLARVNDLIDQVNALESSMASREKYWIAHNQSLRGYEGMTPEEEKETLLTTFGTSTEEMKKSSVEDLMAQRRSAVDNSDRIMIEVVEQELQRRAKNNDPELMKFMNENK